MKFDSCKLFGIRTLRVSWLIMNLVAFLPLRATQTEGPAVPQVETLRSAKSASTNLRLSWTDGTGPTFVVLRSETPNFLASATLNYVSRSAAASPVDDLNVLGDGKSYFYQVSDFYAKTDIYTDTAAQIYKPGDAVTLDGVISFPARRSSSSKGRR